MVSLHQEKIKIKRGNLPATIKTVRRIKIKLRKKKKHRFSFHVFGMKVNGGEPQIECLLGSREGGGGG